MTDQQILTIIVAAIIANIAILSLVVIPLLRRRLRPRADTTVAAPGRTGAEVSTDRLAAVIGARPTLSAAVPTMSGRSRFNPDDAPLGAAFPDSGEDEGAISQPPDVIDAIAAAAATESWEALPMTTTESADARDEAFDMDYTDASVARARGFSIQPEDPLVASTIDRLLGTRRAIETPADVIPSAESFAPIEAMAPVEAEETMETIEPAPAPPAPVEEAPELETGTPVMATTPTAAESAEPTIEPETGLDTPLAWSMALTVEEARSARYGRPVSVVIAELDGLDHLAEVFGAAAADRLIPPVADALRRNARAADRVARLGRTRFGVLLVETDEVRAINYVERVRAACDLWLEASAISLRLSLGWASPATDGDLRSAVRIAEDRMHREQHRPAPWRPIVHAPAAGAPTED